jgi:2-keto-4-pentenoate hydratase/2-oxohepta-3-ene-1,7-dioic acid hydratase in catechol pathway
VIQRRHKQWYRGKSLDNFTPMGPWIVTADEIAFPPRLNIGCRINGELRQNSTTDCLIHGVAEVISELSQGMTLQAGTIIATGTPSGVAMGMENPQYLKAGDVMECFIEKIGTLCNPVK